MSDDLKHYGVKGMKWGVRKDDDASGSGTNRAPNVKRVEKLNKAIEQTDLTISEIRNAPKPRFKSTQRSRDATVKDLEKHREVLVKDRDAAQEGRMAPSKKKLLIGAAAVGGVLAAYGTYKYVDAGGHHRDISNLKDHLRGEKSEWRKKDSLAAKMSADEIHQNVVRQINRGYGELGTKMNCRRCTFAYELRRRGLDVEATRSNAATGQHVVGLLNAIEPGSNFGLSKLSVIRQALKANQDKFEGKSTPFTDLLNAGGWGKNSIDTTIGDPSSTARSIFDALSKNDDGARGELSVGWTFGGGHSMAWEIVGGKPVVFDAQSGKAYKTAGDFEEFAKVVTAAGYTRLDNIPLNDDFLRRWVRNASTKPGQRVI